MAILNNSNAISSGGYDINNSVRLRSSASAYLNRTPGSASNRKTFTWSAWVKRGTLTTQNFLFSAYTAASDSGTFNLYFSSGDSLVCAGGTTNWRITTQLFRDPSAWYHIVVAMDTTQATAANRLLLYVNGVQVTAYTGTDPTLNLDTAINSAILHTISKNANFGTYFDGYMADINFIDGSAKTPSDFGETDTTTGVWKPKAYTGTYGTNGFYLKFSDIATTSGSNAGLGKDFSGNTNYWTTNNISVTAGTTYDAMTDSPTLTSATVANYATLNPVNTGATVSNGNLLSSTTSTAPSPSYSTIGMTSGKYYFECKLNSTNVFVGVWGNGNSSMPTGAFPTYYWDIGASSAGALALEKSSGTASGTLGNLASGDLYGIALDIDNTTIYFYKNNSLVQTVTGMVFTGPLFFALGPWTSSTSSSNFVNFGQQPFVYTPPTGFVRLNTYNLPDSTIVKGNTVMDATTYTGDGATTKSITNAASFKPDLIWVKGRSNTGSNLLQDSNRGFGTATKLSSNSTNAENNASADATDPIYGYVTAANSNGFTVNVGTTPAQTNNNGVTYVGWQWQAGQGTNTSNTSGSTTSTVSVNATAGFSIVKYTGTGSAATIGHGLGVAPKMIIVKGRNTAIEWLVYHTSLGATQYITLNTTGAAASAASAWNNTAPTSSVFSVLSAGSTNFSGTNYVAYCWAEIAGFSKFGSFTGNGSTDGPFVFTNFRPKYILIKNSSNISNWVIFDTSRSPYNNFSADIYANIYDAEYSGGINPDILSNGFKIRTSNSTWNGSGNTFIYMAFAENPFKNSLAR